MQLGPFVFLKEKVFAFRKQIAEKAGVLNTWLDNFDPEFWEFKPVEL